MDKLEENMFLMTSGGIEREEYYAEQELKRALSKIDTVDLVKELFHRADVTTHIVNSNQDYMILCKNKDGKKFGENGIHCSEILSSGNEDGAVILEVYERK